MGDKGMRGAREKRGQQGVIIKGQKGEEGETVRIPFNS